MKLMKTESLDDNNFKEYGWVMRRPDRKYDVANEQLSYWDNCVDLSNFTGNGLLGFLEVKRIPIEMTMMDLLAESVRIYLSIDRNPSIQFVALNDQETNQPDLNTLKAFLLEDGDGVVINKGIWHWTPFSLTEKALFAMGLKNDIMKMENGTYTVDDSKVKYFTLKESIGVQL